jgi:hypothetical protein
MAEVPGMRGAIEQQAERLRQSGVPAAEAARMARESGLRVDRKINSGEIPRKEK